MIFIFSSVINHKKEEMDMARGTNQREEKLIEFWRLNLKKK